MQTKRNTLGVQPLCVLMQVSKRGGCILRMGKIGERLLKLGMIERQPDNAEYVRITEKGIETLRSEWSDAANASYNLHNV